MAAIVLGAGMVLSAGAQTTPAVAGAPHAKGSSAVGAVAIDADVAEVVKLEMAMLEWTRLNQADKVAAYTPEDWIGVPGVALMSRSEMLEDVKTLTMHSYKVTGLVTQRLAGDVVLVIYRMEQDGITASGIKWEPLVQATEEWAKRQGRWLSVFHQETVL